MGGYAGRGQGGRGGGGETRGGWGRRPPVKANGRLGDGRAGAGGAGPGARRTRAPTAGEAGRWPLPLPAAGRAALRACIEPPEGAGAAAGGPRASLPCVCCTRPLAGGLARPVGVVGRRAADERRPRPSPAVSVLPVLAALTAPSRPPQQGDAVAAPAGCVLEMRVGRPARGGSGQPLCAHAPVPCIVLGSVDHRRRCRIPARGGCASPVPPRRVVRCSPQWGTRHLVSACCHVSIAAAAVRRRRTR